MVPLLDILIVKSIILLRIVYGSCKLVEQQKNWTKTSKGQPLLYMRDTPT